MSSDAWIALLIGPAGVAIGAFAREVILRWQAHRERKAEAEAKAELERIEAIKVVQLARITHDEEEAEREDQTIRTLFRRVDALEEKRDAALEALVAARAAKETSEREAKRCAEELAAMERKLANRIGVVDGRVDEVAKRQSEMPVAIGRVARAEAQRVVRESQGRIAAVREELPKKRDDR